METKHLAAKLKNQLPLDGGPTMKRHTHISPDNTSRRQERDKRKNTTKNRKNKTNKIEREQFRSSGVGGNRSL